MIENEISASARSIDPSSAAAQASIPKFMISADSHATEPEAIWKRMPQVLRDGLPLFIGRRKRPEGASDPKARIVDMDKDGVSAEVMYPDTGLGIFAAKPEVQEAAFPIYNDWLAEYCSYSPKRLFGITAVSCYDIDKAIREMHRGHDLGLHGVMVWEVPDPKLPFLSSHYEKLWAAAAELGEPLNIHILTGFNWQIHRVTDVTERGRGVVNHTINDTVNALFDFIWGGIFERHPKLKLGLIESEIGFLPFFLQQWDFYYHRVIGTFSKEEIAALKIKRPPSEIFRDHVCATFMDDQVGCQSLDHWGEGNCMWSSDYPHPNMTWPNSRAFAAKQIGYLPTEKQERLLSKNVIDLYHLDV